MTICALNASVEYKQLHDQEIAGQYLCRYGYYPSWYVPSFPGAFKPTYYYFRVASKVAVYSAADPYPIITS